MTNKNILVIGGAGFIGSAIIRYSINKVTKGRKNDD